MLINNIITAGMLVIWTAYHRSIIIFIIMFIIVLADV